MIKQIRNRYTQAFNRQGLTLIELILVTTIIGLVIGTVGEFFITNLNVSNAQTRQNNLQSEVNSAITAFTRDAIQATLVTSYEEAGGKKTLVLKCLLKQADTPSATPGDPAISQDGKDIVYVKYVADGSTLTRSAGADESASDHPQVLLEHLDGGIGGIQWKPVFATTEVASGTGLEDEAARKATNGLRIIVDAKNGNQTYSQTGTVYFRNYQPE